MATPRHRYRLARLSLLSLALSLVAGIILADRSVYKAAAAPSHDKVSSDLLKQIQQVNSGDYVNVIIQPVGQWSSTTDSELKAASGVLKKSFSKLPFRSARVPAWAVTALAQYGDVGYVALDRPLKSLGHVSLTTGTDAARALGGSTKYDGSGVGIAVLDSGIYASHTSFGGRVVYSQDFTGEGRTDDPYGHGTHVASIAAGNGAVSNGAYQGIGANSPIINLRVLDSQGKGSVSNLLAALDWVMANRTTYNIRVVNMSLGTAAIDSYLYDPLCQAARRLVDAGVVVVAAAGNEGKDSLGREIYGQIHSPGNEPSVITVGAVNTYGTDARTDDGVATYSSRGPTRSYWTDASGVKHYDNLVKPDLVAPGNKIVAAQSPGNYLVANNPLLDANVSGSDTREEMILSGTSMATPIVSGAAAMLLQANPSLTPNLVKAILGYTAQPLARFNHLQQGAGEINVEGAVRMAKAVRADLGQATLSTGAPLLCNGCAMPSQQTSIAGSSFQWSQGFILDQTYGSGSILMTQYQKAYSLGVLLGDGTVERNGVLVGDGVLIGDGVLVGDSLLTSYGTTINSGSYFYGTGVLIGDGVLLGDGVLIGDGVLVGDGVLIGDGVLVGDLAAQAARALVYGDATSCMKAVADPSPGNLTATAASRTQINLVWKDNATSETGFKIERSTDGVTFSQVATVGASVVAFSDTKVTANTRYYYRVRASLSKTSDSDYTNVASASTPQ